MSRRIFVRRFPCVLPVLVLVGSLMGGDAVAATADDLMRDADACEHRLFASEKLLNLRSSWERCIQRFARVTSTYPRHPFARKALERQVLLAEGLARRSGREGDAVVAEELRFRFEHPDADTSTVVRIVIDPGHGGKDPGTISRTGLQEKDVVLDISRRLGNLLNDDRRVHIVLTRTDDRFVSLAERTALAQQKDGDLFVSIHANSSPRRAARGMEVYVLGESSDEDATATAARENDTSHEETRDLASLIQTMLGDLSDSRREQQSLELAHTLRQAITQSVNPRYDLVDLGIKRAPFYVLLNAGMPSILSELAFMSNPDDAKRLAQPAFRQRVAEALASGLLRFTSSPLFARSN